MRFGFQELPEVRRTQNESRLIHVLISIHYHIYMVNNKSLDNFYRMNTFRFSFFQPFFSVERQGSGVCLLPVTQVKPGRIDSMESGLYCLGGISVGFAAGAATGFQSEEGRDFF